MSRAAQAALQEGNSFNDRGQVKAAIAAYRRAIGEDSGFGAAHYNLGVALRRAHDYRGAALAFRAAARLDPKDFDAVQNVGSTLGQAVQSGADPFPAPATPHASGVGAPISIVVCSIDDAKLARMRTSFTRALGVREHEFVVIRDARSLSEAYTRALGLCRHELVVFSHDDVEIASAGAFEAIEAALGACDIVGVAGSRRVTGPAVMWAGHPHVHGWVAHPAKDAPGHWEALYFSLECGQLDGMQALDGLMFATRRALALRVGFDAQAFDGFHFYDLDFTYRAHRAGLRLAVSTDVIAIHASAGDFGDAWKRYAERFAAKFPELRDPVGDYHAYGARFGSVGEVVRFYAALRGLGAVA